MASVENVTPETDLSRAAKPREMDRSETEFVTYRNFLKSERTISRG